MSSSVAPFVLKRAREWVRRGAETHEATPPGPIRELHLELTHRCNLKCVMCHHWETPFKDPGSVAREMDFAKIKSMVESSRALDSVDTVVLTGGEPWLRRDIVDILAMLSKRFPAAKLGVLTNLANREMVQRRLEEIEARDIEVWLGSSIDGLEKTHDEIRGEPGSFSGTEETLKWLRRERPEVDVSFSFTILPKNRKELFEAYLWSLGAGVGFGAQIVVNHEDREAPETFSWKSSEIDDVAVEIDKIIEDLCVRHDAMGRLLRGEEADSAWLWNRILYWDYLKSYSRSPKRFFKNCLAGERFAMVDPEGDLFFCPVNKHRGVGNVSSNPFDEVWSSERAEQERDYVRSCQCDCWLNCVSNPVLDRVLQAGISKETAA